MRMAKIRRSLEVALSAQILTHLKKLRKKKKMKKYINKKRLILDITISHTDTKVIAIDC